MLKKICYNPIKKRNEEKMEQTLYRKYRPKRFSELAGQEHVKQLFQNALSEDGFSHAYIFAGPRGTGKTSVARIVAKRLNCLDPEGSEPCNKCSECLSIQSNSHLDVIEMDAASNRGIDDFRSIRDKVAYKPAQGKYKIYIIDEVHMLTKEAFNAILKTLEEPPEHVVFILATTNPEKIPDTIISRCQIIPFRNVPVKTIIDHLRKMATDEGYAISDDALKYISRRAKGGMRDAIVLLEQVLRVFQKDQELDRNAILKILGGVGEERFEELIGLLRVNDQKGIIDYAEELYDSGVNFEVFLEELSAYILSKIAGIADPQETRTLLELAGKTTEMASDIRFSENQLVKFSVEMLEYASKIGPGIENTQNRFEKKPEPVNKKSLETVKEPVIEPVYDEFLSKLKEDYLSVFTALNLLEYRSTDESIKVVCEKSKPFSNDAVIKHEKLLSEMARKEGKELVVVQEETDKKPEPEKSGKEEEQVPEELKKTYNKLKKLFPEEEIIITENDI